MSLPNYMGFRSPDKFPLLSNGNGESVWSCEVPLMVINATLISRWIPLCSDWQTASQNTVLVQIQNPGTYKLSV